MAVCDPNFASVALLLHCDGTNGSTSFPDASSNANVMTASSVTVTTASPEFGSGCALFNSAGSSNLSCPIVGSPLNLNQSSFTIEGWFLYTSSLAGNLMNDAGTTVFWELTLSSGNLQFIYGTSVTAYTAQQIFLSPTANTWYSFAVVMNNGTLTVYINGQGGTPVATSGTPRATSGTLNFGFNSHVGNSSLMKLDEIRITNGVVLYTSNYTPSGPFPDISCTPTVPNVVGLPVTTAVSTLNSAGFTVTQVQSASSTVSSGYVISQNPAAGTAFPLGSNHTITISTGAAQTGGNGGDVWGASGGSNVSNATPDIIGKTLAYAQHPANAVYTGNQSVMAAESNGNIPLTMATPDSSVPTTPAVG